VFTKIQAGYRNQTVTHYTVPHEPNYVMVDRNYGLGPAFGVIGAIAGNIAAEANSEDANLPTAGIFAYKCGEKS